MNDVATALTLMMAYVLGPVMLFYAIGFAFFRWAIGLSYSWQKFLGGFAVVWILASLGQMYAIASGIVVDSPTPVPALAAGLVLLAQWAMDDYQALSEEDTNKHKKKDKKKKRKEKKEKKVKRSSKDVGKSALPVTNNVQADLSSEVDDGGVKVRTAANNLEDSDRLYEKVWAEVETGNIQAGLWARCFADADGDENRAKASYIKFRVQQLLDGSDS
jgi:hypothetical protein